ncbi:PSD1 and planctomycete cytochrome C domain-containing protein [Rhodopirellula sp. JC740]|uniref:PSD1 and planctomycete cytochrome C domain-containing protein n=1 Tax=Rhodopirellula halodulae TaxID=2894198 RepID=A0ABS8NHU2_9BACT|nr:PSD1 and planctomycete cytochrome C domain-containing protein [Rhodopirellula sp. JC740]MCC9643129.1 PSD1 and planctomycete cytochrome C domain-containing protein [Rhodopirellula sp. JC740]
MNWNVLASCLLSGWFATSLLTPAPLSADELSADSSDTKSTVNFGRDIRPILSDHCFACHGPDEHDRQAGVRLDSADGIADVIDTDDHEASLLIERIVTDDEDMIMPPTEYHKPLSETQVALLKRWIAEGAPYESHWAFSTPQRKPVPGAEASDSDRIDQWILAGVKSLGLSPAGKADRRTLARRVSLDLTGLPPTLEQVEAFVKDSSPDAYENLVDELLATPDYGEHMARYWLDLVRYGDTHGLHLDNYREMWPYRDWVIEAFNQNMPFDEFITKQLAGDLLDEADEAQSLKNKIASGFNRLNVTTNEGGSIYDEVFARNVIDRTDSFGTIFLGLTTGCAVCHDHKFDPITQKDYYALSAYFNSLDGRAMDGNAKDHAPVIRVPSEEQSAELTQLASDLAELDRELAGPLPEVDAAQLEWQRSLSESEESLQVKLHPSEVSTTQGGKAKVNDDASVEWEGTPPAKDVMQIVSPLSDGPWKVLQLHAHTDKDHPRVGTATNQNAVLSEIKIETRPNSEAEWTCLKIRSARANVEQSGKEFAISNAIDGKIDATTGWAVAGHQQTGDRTAWFEIPDLKNHVESPDAQIRVSLHYESVHVAHMLRKVTLSLNSSMGQFPADQQIVLGEVHMVGPLPIQNAGDGLKNAFAGEDKNEFDASRVVTHSDREFQWQHHADVVAILPNTLPADDEQPSVTVLHQVVRSPSDQKVELMIGYDDGGVVHLNGKEVAKQNLGKQESDTFKPLAKRHSLDLKKGDNHLFIRHVNRQGPAKLTYAIKSPAMQFSDALKDRLAKVDVRDESEQALDWQSAQVFYREMVCDHPRWQALQDMRDGMIAMRDKVNGQIATTLVWKETSKPRDAFILQRGLYDSPGDKVERATPGFLPEFPEDAPNDRLGLAKWLLRDDHPLTSRVAVNRFWQQLFGQGLVKSSEDFGSQGHQPTHPELLDELAIDFRESGWNVKELMKRLVMTETYQRDATATQRMLAVDPNNQFFARGPRFRLDAETLRDQLLSVSGRLVTKRGGPSVKPPQPAGLWEAVGYTDSNTANFVADEGDKTLRRSVYTFWKRTSAPAVMSTFDAPSRESCTARRERTNTPMQALLLLNETQAMDAARAMAEQVISLPTPDPSDWEANSRERLRSVFQRVTLRPIETSELRALEALLTDLTEHYTVQLEEARALVGSPNPDWAAWTVVMNTLLNLDEVVCK